MDTLKSYVEWKLTHADKTAEAEGYPMTLENCRNNKKMKQLKICGNSVQDGTPTPENPIEVQSVGELVNLIPTSEDEIGLMGYLMSDGSVVDNYDWLTCGYISVKGNSFTLSGIQGGYEQSICAYDDNYNFITGVKYSNANQVTITADNICYIRFSYKNDWDWSVIRLLEGTTGKYKIPVVQRGINLINVDDFKNGNFKVNEDGSCTLGWNLSSRYSAYNTKLDHIPAGSTIVFKLSLIEATTVNKTLSILLTYKNGTTKYTACNNSTRITLDDNIKEVALYIQGGEEKGSYITFKDFGLYYENEYTSYEPYVQPITTSIFLNEPLRKIGDYADYIDFKNKKVVRNVCLYNPDDINMTAVAPYSRTGYTYAYRFVLSNAINASAEATQSDNPYILCNLFLYGGYACRRMVESVGYSESKLVYFRFDGENNYGAIDVNSFKAWFTQHRPDVYYILNEPTEEPITCELPKLNAKTTIIEVDTSLLPSDAYGKYIKR